MSTEINNNANSFIHCLSIEIANNIRENNPPKISSGCFHKRLSESLKELNKESKLFAIGNIDIIHEDDIGNAIDQNLKNIVKTVVSKIVDATSEKLNPARKKEIESALKNSFCNSSNIKNALERLKNTYTKLKDINDTYQKAKTFSDNYQKEKNKAIFSSDSDIWKNFKKMSALIIIDLPSILERLSSEEKTMLKTQYKITEKSIQEIHKPIFEERYAVCIKLQNSINELFDKLDQGFELKDLYENFTPLTNQTILGNMHQLVAIKNDNDIELKKEIKKKLQDLFIFMKSPEGVQYHQKHIIEAFALAARASSLGIKIDISGD